ncbi:bardet-biedl syndrome 5 protein [Angomonas deanei]|nr:bardet-biedl syndrome 5 protein [Angomonas deanei]|eukprot:EPY34891.1 bardet-biedl syndrome 5 protein [Angomonas deanei]
MTQSGKRIFKEFTFWQDREVRVDSEANELRLRDNAEESYAAIREVEDSKVGYLGLLRVTNLRVIWICDQKKRMNLSIGYYCMTKVAVKEVESRLGTGKTEALMIGAKFGSSNFTFYFALRSNNQLNRNRLTTAVQSVWRAYDSTRIYREIRLRSATVQDGNVVILPQESVISKITGVTNMGKEKEHKGILVVTNVRLVWYSVDSDSFNISIPYLQLTSISYRVGEKGTLLMLETSSYGGSLTLGFLVQPLERLEQLYKEVSSIWKGWTSRPILGIQVELNTTREVLQETQEQPEVLPERRDGENVIANAPEDAFAAYYADEGQKAVDRKPTYEPSIGLAVEKLRKGVTIQQLWEVTTT